MDGDIGGIPFGKDIDPYNVLDLQTSATPGEVKTAYKRLALKHHPGKGPVHTLCSSALMLFN